MATSWTINGQSFAATGLSKVVRQRYNMATDRVTFEADGRGIDAALLFAYDQPVSILREGQPFFSGRAGRTPKTGTPQAEGHSYEVLGPWDQLERLVYQQGWPGGSWIQGVWTPRTDWKSRVVLGQGSSGAAITIADAITDVISYATSCGVSLQAGSIVSPIYIPWDEALDLSCAEAIRRLARWVPSGVGWVDYSTPVPRFNFRSIATQPALSLSLGSRVSEIQLTQVGSRSVPAVVINYEVSYEVNGSQMTGIVTDAWPSGSTGRQVGAVVQTIQLAGGSLNQTKQRQEIRSVAIPSMNPPGNAPLRTWFLAKHPEYVDAKFQNLTITAANRVETLPYELVEGSLQDWMRRQLPTYNAIGNIVWTTNPDNKYSFSDREDTIRLTIAYKVVDGNGNTLREVSDQIIVVKITATDCPSGKYSRTITDTLPGEGIPSGLAQALYTDLNAPHYQGSIKVISEEVTGAEPIGARVMISGGDPAWSTMAACVQSVSDFLDTGASVLQVGPPSHITPSEILDLRRANRVRRPAVSSPARTSGETTGGSVDLASAQPKSIHGSSPGLWGVPITVVTAVRFDSASNCLQAKVRNVVVAYAEADGSWVTVEGGQADSCL